ncbi:MAG TPA: hypothetical protein VIE35_08320 [Dongiaceae bacterium]
MPLSVASVLARLGTDPWVEAGRLARLPQAKATEALAAMIAQVPMPSWQPSEVAGIVARLIALLPGAAAAPPPRPEPKQSTPARSEPTLRDRPSRSRSSWYSMAAWVLCLALVTAAAFAALSDGMPAEDRSGAPIAVHSNGAPADCKGDCLREFQFNKEMGYGQGSKTQ